MTDEKKAFFEEHGYLVLRNHFSESETDRLLAATLRKIKDGQYVAGYDNSTKYPAPAKYSVVRNDWADPDFAFIVEHPRILSTIEPLLGAPAALLACAAYLRTANDGQPWETLNDIGHDGKHCDYKRWRPVGSSMNWLFTIIPCTDFDADRPLLVAPGSHKLITRVDRREPHGVLDAIPPNKMSPILQGKFMDPQLKRGDLLILHQGTWHQAPPNKSGKDRMGMFNKYCAINCPPATGWFPWNEAAYNALRPAGRRLLAVHSDKPITTTRLVLDRQRQGRDPELLLVRRANSTSWSLPGGRAWEEEVLKNWDEGAKIGALEVHCEQQLGVTIPWMSYIADFEEGDHLCRVYGYPIGDLEDDGIDLRPNSELELRWATQSELVTTGKHRIRGFVAEAFKRWLHEDVVRGVGVSQRVGQSHPFGSLSQDGN